MYPIDESKKKEGEKLPPSIESYKKSLANKLVEKVIHLMKENAVDELAIERKYLPEIFSANLLKLSKDGLPTLKLFVLKEFYLMVFP